MKTLKVFPVTGCHGCPYIDARNTPGAGYAQDYFCLKTGSKVDGYIEWDSEKRKPGDFPSDCPLEDLKP